MRMCGVIFIICLLLSGCRNIFDSSLLEQKDVIQVTPQKVVRSDQNEQKQKDEKVIIHTENAGISYSNIVNGGFVSENDDSTFYVDGYNGILYELNKSTAKKSKVNGLLFPNYVNVIGYWIYYSNTSDEETMYKIKVDGTQKMKINSDKSTYLNVVGDWIYFIGEYTGSEYNRNLYRIKTDGSNKQKLNDGTTNCLTIFDNSLYFLEDYHLYKSNLDGTNKTKFIDLIVNILMLQKIGYFLLINQIYIK